MQTLKVFFTPDAVETLVNLDALLVLCGFQPKCVSSPLAQKQFTLRVREKPRTHTLNILHTFRSQHGFFNPSTRGMKLVSGAKRVFGSPIMSCNSEFGGELVIISPKYTYMWLRRRPYEQTMICKSVFEKLGKAGPRGIVLGRSSPVEQSSVQVQYDEEALWRGEKIGNSMSVIEIGRRRGRSREVNQVTPAIGSRRRVLAKRSRGDFEISGLRRVERSTGLRYSLLEVVWWRACPASTLDGRLGERSVGFGVSVLLLSRGG